MVSGAVVAATETKLRGFFCSCWLRSKCKEHDGCYGQNVDAEKEPPVKEQTGKIS